MILNKILLIDDNDIDCYISSHLIKKNTDCKEVIIKNSAIDALNYLNTLFENNSPCPDLILLDIKMPEMDGFDFLNEITKCSSYDLTDYKIIMLSSSNDIQDRERAFKHAIVKDYFVKPLQLSKLLEFIKTN